MGSQAKGTRHESSAHGKAARTDDVMTGKGSLRGFGGTGQSDASYDLVSVLYHALQGAETYGRYVLDAEKVGDRELVQFFTAVREEEVLRAQRARVFLASRIDGGGGGSAVKRGIAFDDEEEE